LGALAGRYGVDFDPFATPRGNVCYLRIRDGWSRRKPAVRAPKQQDARET
jgi:hypothetical protein